MPQIPKDKSREGYTPTTTLADDATTQQIIDKVNELVEKVEELVDFFIGEE